MDAIPFTPPKQYGKWRNRISSWGQLLFDPKPHLAYVYDLENLRRRMLALLSQQSFDFVQLEFLFSAPLGDALLGIPWILEEHNVEYLNQARLAKIEKRGARKLAAYLESRKLKRWERSWVSQCSVCLTVSKTDAAILKQLSHMTPIYTVPNGVACDHFQAKPFENRNRTGLLFLGNLGYGPNRDAIDYFCQEIFPMVLAQHPETTLTIMGSNAPRSVMELGKRKGINYIGYVDDVIPYLHQSKVCIVPLRSGSGTRLKILEAMAAGLPVVSTRMGAEGLEVSHERDILLADAPEDFSSCIRRLLEDEHLAERLRINALRLVKEKYDWENLASEMEEVYQHLIPECC